MVTTGASLAGALTVIVTTSVSVRTPSLTVNSTSYTPGVSKSWTGLAVASVGEPSLKSHKYSTIPVSSLELSPVKLTVKVASPEITSDSINATGAALPSSPTFHTNPIVFD